MAIVVEVINQRVDIDEEEKVTHIVEVVRRHTAPVESTHGARVVDLVQPGGTMVNAGVGPELPEHPYEGQIWIKV